MSVNCARCRAEAALDRNELCPACALAYDGWIRQYAGDIVAPAIAGMVIVMFIGLVVPLLGAPYLLALSGVFAGFGTIAGLHRLQRRRRRRQFLGTTELPRAYLPSKT